MNVAEDSGRDVHQRLVWTELSPGRAKQMTATYHHGVHLSVCDIQPSHPRVDDGEAEDNAVADEGEGALNWSFLGSVESVAPGHDKPAQAREESGGESLSLAFIQPYVQIVTYEEGSAQRAEKGSSSRIHIVADNAYMD
eukprot:2067025-Prymnesium_polylepis.1